LSVVMLGEELAVAVADAVGLAVTVTWVAGWAEHPVKHTAITEAEASTLRRMGPPAQDG
jgi:hypothetical protein